MFTSPWVSNFASDGLYRGFSGFENSGLRRIDLVTTIVVELYGGVGKGNTVCLLDILDAADEEGRGGLA